MSEIDDYINEHKKRYPDINMFVRRNGIEYSKEGKLMPAQMGFGFDCVIKAFRIGKKVSRASYTEGTSIYYDTKENLIYCIYHDGKKLTWTPTVGDMMAKDWFVTVEQ